MGNIRVSAANFLYVHERKEEPANITISANQQIIWRTDKNLFISQNPKDSKAMLRYLLSSEKVMYLQLFRNPEKTSEREPEGKFEEGYTPKGTPGIDYNISHDYCAPCFDKLMGAEDL